MMSFQGGGVETTTPTEIKGGGQRCSEEAIRSMIADFSDAPGAEVLQELRNYYYDNACADYMDIERLEEIFVEELQQQGSQNRRSEGLKA